VLVSKIKIIGEVNIMES